MGRYNGGKSSSQRTRELFKGLGYRVEGVESFGFHGRSKDFLGFIDDIAFNDDFMVGIQSCLNTDLELHRKKFRALVAENAIICAWMAACELWLVWWTEVKHTDKRSEWVPAVEVLNLPDTPRRDTVHPIPACLMRIK